MNPTLLNYLIPISNFAIAGSVLITAGVISKKDFSFSIEMPSTPVVTQTESQSSEDSNVLDIRIVEMPGVDVDLNRAPTRPLQVQAKVQAYPGPLNVNADVSGWVRQR